LRFLGYQEFLSNFLQFLSQNTGKTIAEYMSANNYGDPRNLDSELRWKLG